jgi:N-methylhydantoinase A
VLGRLNQEALLGGAFPIDAARARSAVGRLGAALALSLEMTAEGIVRLIDHAMAKVLRIVTVERGLDPREFALVAFGGAGPLHACAVSDELAISRIVVPQHPGLFSAHGLLEANLHTADILAVLRSTGEVNQSALQRWFEESEERAGASLIEQGAGRQTIVFRREYDARYRGQSFELTIDHADSAESIAQRFHDAHRARYGYDVRSEIVELINARLTGVGALSPNATPSHFMDPRPENSVERRREDTRRVWLDGSFNNVPVLQRADLREDERIEGPAIVEEYDCTTYVAPQWSLVTGADVLVLEKMAK